MTLQSSGQISASDINIELGRGSSSYFNLNGSAERNLAQRYGDSTYIAFSDFYGRSNCPPYGTFWYAWCSGCTYYYRYHNGSCGYYDQVIEYNSQSCGCCPSYYTYLGYDCFGCALYYRRADGGCGFFYEYIENPSQTCGCCPGYYTYLGQICFGCQLYNRRADGGCGEFYEFVESNSPSCGCCPAYGTYYTAYCSGCTYYYRYHNGSCGYYDQAVEFNSPNCGCGGGNACQQQGYCATIGTISGYQYVCAYCGFAGWGWQPYTDDSPLGAVATHVGRLSSGSCDYIYVLVYGCDSGFVASNRNCSYSSNWANWCGMYVF